MRTSLLLTVLFSVLTVGAYAADPGARTYANPDCSSRTAKPEDCLIQDGPPRRAIAAEEKKTPEGDAQPGPSSGASFTPPKGKPPAEPAQKAGTSLTPPVKPGNPPSPQSGTSFTAPKKGK